ncbi:zinc-binding alcohol dehydrogenase family protein [Periweissella cryptocerci]|uniref:Zinc-type alcohol dehydrogenase-like protein n=1 Tax=Periweissella cryptocerci TaxID=2506420 RepID=A0A4P6YVI7_9LACO|nr:zinc-binding alcohol dehydrogenase family protein [Periweissella cryptocerci]QBO36869.1 zinc-binding alcohol dehydrogenase family protein [Periweissella cryptocerci]
MSDVFRAIGAYEGLPIADTNALQYVELPLVQPEGHDILVKVKAVSVNPVDAKLRSTLPKSEKAHIYGYDAVGEVVAVGEAVTKFIVGEQVFYAGVMKRAGSDAEYQLVDEAVVAIKPETLTNAEAAAMPLTSLTAFELMFEKMGMTPAADAHDGETLLVINGAGGVGSVMIQLAKWLGMTVIATASRPETVAWVEKMGADFVVNHREDYVAALSELGFDAVDYIALLHSTERHFPNAAKLIAPFGHIGAIVEAVDPLPMSLIKNKSVSFDWEFMFAKGNYDYQLTSQGEYLAEIARLLDDGILVSTLTKELDAISLANLRTAHAQVEADKMIGKIVLSGQFV